MTGEGPGFRNSRWDRAALPVTVDPSWLLAPLYVREVAGLQPAPPGPGAAPFPGPLDPRPAPAPLADGVDSAAASSGWPGWWAAALDYRPGTPAPLVSDLIGECPALQAMWATVESGFTDWLAARAPSDPVVEQQARRIERDALAGFAASQGRDPGRWTVRMLQIPVGGHYLYAPDERRIVVSASLRHDAGAYPMALAAELPHHF
jgi:hypothetical protein